MEEQDQKILCRKKMQIAEVVIDRLTFSNAVKRELLIKNSYVPHRRVKRLPRHLPKHLFHS